MENLLSGVVGAVAVLAIFVASLVMATLTQTFAENFYPDLKDKRDMLFWVWLFLWIGIFTLLWTSVKGFINL